ncbi:SMI1/KNR4 family protein [Streptomyces sp. NPDC006649]|uniref:SMI1/KNR4 family protein n=1 Tax=Streptomyces sp. NPDC006649 TaxID=3156896 RepID=UPI0033A9DCC3
MTDREQESARVGEAWDRIESWLSRHAPQTMATLNGPAGAEEIRGAERQLGVTFPPGLVASLRRNNGAGEQRGNGPCVHADFTFPTHDRLLSAEDIVSATTQLRGVMPPADDDPQGRYWHQSYVKFADYEVTADGLTVDCRDGEGSGRVGRFFDESGTDFGLAPALSAYLSDVAEALERRKPVHGRWPLVFNGRLLWETASEGNPDWGTGGDPVPGQADGLPTLDLVPKGRVRATELVRLDELGAVLATASTEQVDDTAGRQMWRLSQETGLIKYPEVAEAINQFRAGNRVELTDTNRLGLRLRAVIHASRRQKDPYRRWSAQALVTLLVDGPHRAVLEIADVSSHVVLNWREVLWEDFGPPPLPPMPDEDFWANLRHPWIEAG